MHRVGLFLLLLSALTPKLRGQIATPAPQWNWAQLAKLPRMRPAELHWLRDSLPAADAAELLQLVSALKSPDEAQLLPAFFYLDGSVDRPKLRPLVDSLGKRPPAGQAGLVRVAYLVGRLRRQVLGKRLVKLNIRWPAASPVRTAATQAAGTVQVKFDLRPARTFLHILATPDPSVEAVAAQLQGPFFEALVKHRSQPFYDLAVTREQLARCLASAASTRPLDRLYRYANPRGLINFADLQNNRAQYEEVVAGLAAREAACAAYVQAQLGPYLPAGLRLRRPVAFSFVAGAGGWQTDSITAVELTATRGNLSDFLPLLAHETLHAVQEAVNPEDTTKVPKSGRQAFAKTVDYMFREGTASFAATPMAADSNFARQVTRGAQLLDEVRRASFERFDPARVQALEDEGVAGDGPFYALGEAMARLVVAQFGAPELGRCFRQGGLAFCRRYLDAERKAKKPPLFGPELVRALEKAK